MLSSIMGQQSTAYIQYQNISQSANVYFRADHSSYISSFLQNTNFNKIWKTVIPFLTNFVLDHYIWYFTCCTQSLILKRVKLFFFLNTRQYKWSISFTRCSAENFRICMLNHPTGNFGLNLQLCYGNQIKHIQKTDLEMYS